jgi:Zn-finger nucleic acid-binding protein
MMTLCTSCNIGKLLPANLETALKAKQCNHCHGHWILIEDFVRWKQQASPETTAEVKDTEDHQYHVADDSIKALLCPISGTLMRKFRIKADSRRRIDYSPAVGAIWLDDGEWQLIKLSGLAGSLNVLVTEHYQHQLRRESTKQQLSEIYSRKFGAEQYQKVQDFRAWLEQQPNQADLKAYLMVQDPYRG